MDGAPELLDEAAPPLPIKKTRTRKKAETASGGATEPGSVVQAESGETPPVTSPKRSRKKKNADEAGSLVETEVRTPSASTGPVPQISTDADSGVPLVKPKRTRRVGEPKPKRYPVGEQEAEQGV